MRILFVCERYGTHEQRFSRAFTQRGHTLEPITFAEIEQSDPSKGLFLVEEKQPDLVLAGPLHLTGCLCSLDSNVPLIAVSYAYDLLYLAPSDEKVSNQIRGVLNRSNGLLVDCHAVEKQAREILGLDESPSICVAAWGLEKVDVFENPESPYHSIRTHFGWNEGKIIISVRNFTPLHGVIDVARAFVKVSRIDSLCKMLFVGSGQDEEAIRDIVTTAGLDARVGFTGQVAEHELSNLMSQADLYVSASVVDGISISLLQALDAGLPVILSNVGGNSEFKDALGGHCLFPSGDVASLQEKIVYALSHSSRQQGQWNGLLAEKANWERNSQLIVDYAEFVVQLKENVI